MRLPGLYIELWNKSLENSNKEDQGGSGSVHVPGCGFQIVFHFDVCLSER